MDNVQQEPLQREKHYVITQESINRKFHSHILLYWSFNTTYRMLYLPVLQ
jgi:hypothetical protein